MKIRYAYPRSIPLLTDHYRLAKLGEEPRSLVRLFSRPYWVAVEREVERSGVMPFGGWPEPELRWIPFEEAVSAGLVRAEDFWP